MEGETRAEPILKRPRFSNPNWPVADKGFIVFDVSRNSLDAHCGHLHHVNKKNPCRLCRGCTESVRSKAKGRPVGLLIAWLMSARPTQKQHTGMLKTSEQQPPDLVDLSHETRDRWRQWAKTHGLQPALDLERPRRKDRAGNFLEPEEPDDWA